MCLSLIDENVNSFNLKNRFYDLIRLYTSAGYRNTICESILEKSNIMFFGIYDLEADSEEAIVSPISGNVDMSLFGRDHHNESLAMFIQSTLEGDLKEVPGLSSSYAEDFRYN